MDQSVSPLSVETDLATPRRAVPVLHRTINLLSGFFVAITCPW